MDDYERGLYTGFFESWAFENGLHKDGISRHRVPVIFPSYDGRDDFAFDMEKFLEVEADLDSEGGIFEVGFEEEGREGFVILFCTEAENATWWEDDDRDGRIEFAVQRYQAWLAAEGPVWGVR